MHNDLVIDIETIRHPDLSTWLSTETRIAQLGEMSEQHLRRRADADGIKVGNLKDPQKIRDKIAASYRADEDKAAVSWWGCAVCAIGAKELHGADDDLEAMQRGEDLALREPYTAPVVWTSSDTVGERDILEAFIGRLDVLRPERLVGFNIRGSGRDAWRKGFDIPILRVRCMMLGIPWPTWLPQNVREDRYSDRLFDICDVLAEGSLDHWLRAAGLPPKNTRGPVDDLTPGEIALRCANDVELERLLAAMVMPRPKED